MWFSVVGLHLLQTYFPVQLVGAFGTVESMRFRWTIPFTFQLWFSVSLWNSETNNEGRLHWTTPCKFALRFYNVWWKKSIPQGVWFSVVGALLAAVCSYLLKWGCPVRQSNLGWWSRIHSDAHGLRCFAASSKRMKFRDRNSMILSGSNLSIIFFFFASGWFRATLPRSLVPQRCYVQKRARSFALNPEQHGLLRDLLTPNKWCLSRACSLVIRWELIYDNFTLNICSCPSSLECFVCIRSLQRTSSLLILNDPRHNQRNLLVLSQ